MPDIVRTARPGEVARMLGVDPKTVSRYAAAGRIPCSTTPSGHRRFNLNEVRAALSVTAPAGAGGPESFVFELEQIEADLARLTVRVHAFARDVAEHLTGSRLYFSSPSGEAELGGAEWHWLRRLAQRPGEAAWDLSTFDRAEQVMALIERDRSSGHLFDSFEKAKSPGQAWTAKRDFLETLRLALRVETYFLPIAGVRLRTSDVELNTALVAGSDLIRLAAKLSMWADRFPFVEGPDRAWLADLIEQGLKSGMYRRTLNGYDLGWPAVVEFLRSRDDEPVVVHYSVEDSFPSRSVADWTAPQMPEGWVPEWARDEQGRTEWEAEYHDPQEYWDEHVSDLWYELPEAERWERSLAGLREKRPWIRLYPDLAHHTFHLGVTVYDLFAPDRDERVLAAAREE